MEVIIPKSEDKWKLSENKWTKRKEEKEVKSRAGKEKKIE